MRRDFADREDLESYLKSEFPNAEGALSDIPGGRKAALRTRAVAQPELYEATRNYIDGAVTRLSPYLRHGVLTLAEMRQWVHEKCGSRRGYKLLQELAWRDYWQRLYGKLGAGIWRDQEAYKTRHDAHEYSATMPSDIADGNTGLACIDAFVEEIKATGYLHNHARMWFASYVIHWRKVKWQAGAFWFLRHLLDGDPASNNLSWQWVASTFSHKPYFFNRENLEKYTRSRYCRKCSKAGQCDFEGTYGDVEDRLFRIQGAA